MFFLAEDSLWHCVSSRQRFSVALESHRMLERATKDTFESGSKLTSSVTLNKKDHFKHFSCLFMSLCVLMNGLNDKS